MRIIRNSIALLIGLICSVSMFSQLPVSFGVKAGINLSEIQKIDDNVKVGFNIGLTAELALPSNFYLMSGLEFTTKGTKGKNTIIDATGPMSKATYNAIYIQLPIHAGYKLDLVPGTKLVFRAGPYLAYGVGGKIKWDITNYGESDFFNDHSNRFDFGIGGAVGVEFSNKISVNLGADQGLTNISKDTSTKNRCAHISVGYKF
ncbi:PorT family protein [Dysgonomonas sp. Marseille-P4677]|uniref:porin family protein n=1 Tax=Dysgonomonas sp. Marseille-P4677 TaxID=2364790 RepID=UPI0019146B19|nr:porin family protein [Dysgonomonas sp. Marseille-P4677]MBK5721413.1 PorT family protein [Dysgonomonas sp. Marseille-P4677]